MNMFERHTMQLAHDARIEAQAEVKRLLGKRPIEITIALVVGLIIGGIGASVLWAIS